MWPADRGRLWPLAVSAVLLGALVLRVWGYRHGLPFVYNADENAHFVARAIGMFGHTYNPNYFINPPGYTYLLHALFWLRWGGEEVQRTLAGDPTAVYGLARLATAVLGTAAVGLLMAAGARLFGRWTGLLAGALLAVAFLPVHYSHYALNDVPTLAPLSLALFGAAGVLRRGTRIDYVIAGVGLGLACATKYTAGIVVLCLLAAAVASPRRRGRASGLGLAGIAAAAAFLLANPFALLDFEDFRSGLEQQSAASNDGGGKLGLTDDNGVLYYLWTLTWGLGWVPLAAAAGGAVALVLRDRRAAWVLLPAVVAFVAFMGGQDRFFARWLLPVYPILCLVAAHGAVAAARIVSRRVPRPLAWAPGGVAVGLLFGQGLLYSVHNDIVLSRPDTRQLAREWMVENIAEGSKVVVEPIAPDQWAMDPGDPRMAGNGNRWNKWPTSRSLIRNDGTRITSGRGRIVKLEDYERTTRPALIDSYERGGYCWVVTGSTQFGRAFAEPDEVPRAIAYYRELERRGEIAYRISPYGSGAPPASFSFDFSFNHYPLGYERPGPEIIIYRLTGARCAERSSVSS
jgi:hypothetical protein